MISIASESDASLVSYAAISTAFEVHEVVDVGALQADMPTLPTRPVSPTWLKDYDALAGNDPPSWPAKYGIRHWCFLAAYIKDVRVGGAVVVVRQEDVAQLGGRASFALLWDLRVAQSHRRQGVGRALLAQADVTARDAGCRGVEVETQDVNVPACRLYAAAGFRLHEVTPFAYSAAPREIRLIWQKTIDW